MKIIFNMKIKVYPALIVFMCIWMLLPVTGFCSEPTPEEMKSRIKVVQVENNGTVLRVGDNEIVIDDRLFYLSNFVSYHKIGDSGVASKNIKPGTKVCFNLNDKGEIVDIWILSN